MSYQLGRIPSPRPTLSEIADFMEFNCITNDNGSFSTVELSTAMGIPGDDGDVPGEDPENYDCALSEVDDRYIFANRHYPFETSNKSIRIRTDVNDVVKDIYFFLLLSTRENMSAGRVADGIDGTAIFEELCAAVLKNYFGESCCSFVFGTGCNDNDTFGNRVQKMLDSFTEGKMSFRHPDSDKKQQKDGKLDIVAYIPFADRKKGQFIAFGQCKTGTNWQASISQLNPKAFCDSYCTPPPGFTPIAVFMVAEAFEENWELLLRYSNGILFDRLRIMNYLPQKIEEDLLSKIRKWNTSVIRKYHGSQVSRAR